MIILMLHAIDLHCRQLHPCSHSATVLSQATVDDFGQDVVKTCPDPQIKDGQNLACWHLSFDLQEGIVGSQLPRTIGLL